MPASEAAILDRVAERAARGLAARTTRRSVLGRVGDKLLALVPTPYRAEAEPRPIPDGIAPPPPAENAEPVAAQDRPLSGSTSASPPSPANVEPPEAQDGPSPGSTIAAPARPAPESPPTQLLGAPAPPPPTPPASTPPSTTTSTSASATTLPGEPVAATVAISRVRFEASSSVVLARADALTLAIAAPLAAALNAPLLAVDGALDLATGNELNRLGATRRLTVGLDLPGAEPVGADNDDLGVLSIAVAQLVRQHAGTVRAFAIGDSDDAKAIAGPVAAAAAVRKFPVMIGAEAARHGAMEGDRRAAVTYLVGQDVIAAAATVPGGFPLPAPTNAALVARLGQLLRADRIETDTAAVTRADVDPNTTAALAASGGPVLYEVPDPPPATLFTV